MLKRNNLLGSSINEKYQMRAEKHGILRNSIKFTPMLYSQTRWLVKCTELNCFTLISEELLSVSTNLNGKIQIIATAEYASKVAKYNTNPIPFLQALFPRIVSFANRSQLMINEYG